MTGVVDGSAVGGAVVGVVVGGAVVGGNVVGRVVGGFVVGLVVGGDVVGGFVVAVGGLVVAVGFAGTVCPGSGIVVGVVDGVGETLRDADGVTSVGGPSDG
jgi:hypothetical protein